MSNQRFNRLSPAKYRGFTIVELLIVIVVVGILASISVVGYNGVRGRAENAATISTVDRLIKSIRMYKISEGDYPLNNTGSNGSWCATMDNECSRYDGVPRTNENLWLAEALEPYGGLPSSAPKIHSSFNGISYQYSTEYVLDGQPNPVIIMLWLKGEDQDCTSIQGMASAKDSGGSNNMVSRRNSNTIGDVTRCYLMFPNETL